MSKLAPFPTDDDLIEQLRRTMAAVADAAPDLSTEDRHPDRRWLAVAAAVATVGIAAGGWLAVTRHEARTLPPLDPNDPRPTLDSFRFTYDEELRLNNASERMYRDCMGTKGQVYAFPGISAEQIRSADLDPMWGLLGRTDAARASTLGYEPMAVRDPIDPNAAHINDPNWLTAYLGSPDGNGPVVELIDPETGLPTPGDTQASGGCFGAIQAALFGDQARFTGLNMYVANQLDGGRIDMQAGADPRLRPFEAAWSDCMVATGHPRYRAPLDAMRHFFEASPDGVGRVPSADEVATAVDDVACKQSSGLLRMAQDLHDAYSREAAARAPDITAAHREFIDHALAQAAAFESGTLVGPWRASASAEAPRNSAECVWLPIDVIAIDMSIGERAELTAYIDALEAVVGVETDAPVAEAVGVPPWLLGLSTCVADPTLARIAAGRPAA